MEIKIGNKVIGNESPTFIIAELSANHLQNYELAVNTIQEIKKAGADAVKIQTYTPDTMTVKSENDLFKIKEGTIWDGKTFYDLYKEAYTPWEWQPKLKKIAERLGLVFFSSPFDKSAVDFLYTMNVPAYKIASFEITDIPLIEYVASKGKPIIISTGIATLSNIEEALDACKRMGNKQIILLKCTSSYPAPFGEINLKTIPNMKETFQVIVGLSDHTIGSTVPVASVALGAKVIEKHFILKRSQGGPDSDFSMEPHEFRHMVNSIREAEEALGNITYELTDKMKNSQKHSRSLFVVKDMNQGEVFTDNNIRSIRPGQGLHPRYYNEIVGKISKKNIKKGTPLSWDLIE